MVTITAIEWKVLKHKGCFICGEKEPKVTLDRAHLRANHKGGTTIVPMCVEHHRRYDQGRLDKFQLGVLGITKAEYARLIPQMGRAFKLRAKPKAAIILPKGIGAQTKLNFEPAAVTVAPGTTIVFINKDATSIHDVDFVRAPARGNPSTNPSPNTNKWIDNMYSVTLTAPGTYTYVCDYHAWMKGTITVIG
jgi:plastocyanin